MAEAIQYVLEADGLHLKDELIVDEAQKALKNFIKIKNFKKLRRPPVTMRFAGDLSPSPASLTAATRIIYSEFGSKSSIKVYNF